METISDTLEFFLDGSNWAGSQGIPVRLLEHIRYSALAVLLALIPSLLLGLYIGHRRRLEFITITTANLGRALPSFAILALAFPIGLQFDLGFTIWPTVVTLFFLAVPPILTNTYVGVREVDPDVVESARGMGLSGRQLLRQVELPLAAPLIMAGIRTSSVQVVATATLAALIAGGGLGRFIVDGVKSGDDPKLLAGAVLVALLAILTEVFFGALERFVRPRSGRRLRRLRKRNDGIFVPGLHAGEPQAPL